MIGVLLAVVPLAMLDSLNPATLAMGAALTTVDRPVRALQANITAVYATYFSIGAIAALTSASLIREALTINASAVEASRLMPGLLLIAVALYLWRTRRRGTATYRPHPRIGRTRAALLGLLVTILDAPTAVPYIAAIAIITHAHLDAVETLVILTVYCEIYTLPLQAVLAIHVRMGRAGDQLIVAMRRRIARWGPVVLSAFCLVIGLALSIDALLPLLS